MVTCFAVTMIGFHVTDMVEYLYLCDDWYLASELNSSSCTNIFLGKFGDCHLVCLGQVGECP